MQQKKIIAHIMMESPYRIGMGYQENFLAAKHVELGYDVHVISTSDALIFPENIQLCPPCTYSPHAGLTIHYLAVNHSVLRKIPFVVGWTRVTVGLYVKLAKVNPDIIFLHGICKFDNIDVINYCKSHTDVALYVDNHSDYYNTPVNNLREKSFRYGVGRYIGSKLNVYAKRVWGVSPWRVTYQERVYGIRHDISDLLVMGGDEKTIRWEQRDEVRTSLRKHHDISPDAFVVITGGKIDATKNIHHLIEAITCIKDIDIHLFIFGRFESAMTQYAQSITDKRIHIIGWISPDEANNYYLASDLACFPGTHSVLWEQACACGLPAVFKDWNGGFSHVDVGGNCILLHDISPESLNNTITDIVRNEQTYKGMKDVAENVARKQFSYIDIAKRAIEIE